MNDVGNIVGYIGAGLLTIRLYPIIYEQINNPKEINLKYLGIEFLATIFLGTSAFLLKAIPFIIANSLTFVNVTIIIICQLKIKYKTKIDQLESEI